MNFTTSTRNALYSTINLHSETNNHNSGRTSVNTRQTRSRYSRRKGRTLSLSRSGLDSELRRSKYPRIYRRNCHPQRQSTIRQSRSCGLRRGHHHHDAEIYFQRVAPFSGSIYLVALLPLLVRTAIIGQEGIRHSNIRRRRPSLWAK